MYVLGVTRQRGIDDTHGIQNLETVIKNTLYLLSITTLHFLTFVFCAKYICNLFRQNTKQTKL